MRLVLLLSLLQLHLAAAGLLGFFQSKALERVAARDASICHFDGVVIEVRQYYIIVKYDIFISTYITYNTIFSINEATSITISNAPTQLVTTVTATQSVTTTLDSNTKSRVSAR